VTWPDGRNSPCATGAANVMFSALSGRGGTGQGTRRLVEFRGAPGCEGDGGDATQARPRADLCQPKGADSRLRGSQEAECRIKRHAGLRREAQAQPWADSESINQKRVGECGTWNGGARDSHGGAENPAWGLCSSAAWTQDSCNTVWWRRQTPYVSVS